MCLYIDYDGGTTLAEGFRKARKTHMCIECGRNIEPGERYFFHTYKHEEMDGLDTVKMCQHCRATITLGSQLTGCPEQWFYSMVFDWGSWAEEGGFVADILINHRLPKRGLYAMLRALWAVKGGPRMRPRQPGDDPDWKPQPGGPWRKPDGTLRPIPALPAGLEPVPVHH